MLARGCCVGLGTFLSDEEVVSMVDHLKKSTEAHYDNTAMEWNDEE